MKFSKLFRLLLVVLMLAVGGVIALSPVVAQAQGVKPMSYQVLAQYLQSLSQQLEILEKQFAAEKQRNPDGLTTINLTCVDLPRTLAFGTTGNDVSALQTFLSETGDFDNREALGIFGFHTLSAVQSFQRREGIVSGGSPSTTGYGVVGPLTRERIRILSCNSGVSQITAPAAPIPAPVLPSASSFTRPIQVEIRNVANNTPLAGVRVDFYSSIGTLIATVDTLDDGRTPPFNLTAANQPYVLRLSKSGYQMRAITIPVFASGSALYYVGNYDLYPNSNSNPNINTPPLTSTTTIASTVRTLNLSIVGSGSVNRSSSGPNYNHGTVVTLTAVPSAGATFTGWSGGLSGTLNPINITMNSSFNVVANFTTVAPSQSLRSFRTKINDQLSLSPLSGVTVEIIRQSDNVKVITQTSDANGYTPSVPIRLENHTLRFSKTGYESRTLGVMVPTGSGTFTYEPVYLLPLSYYSSPTTPTLPGPRSATVNITINGSPNHATVTGGTTFNLAWNVTGDTTACGELRAGESWSGIKSLSGSETITAPWQAMTNAARYTLTCTGSIGSWNAVELSTTANTNLPASPTNLGLNAGRSFTYPAGGESFPAGSSQTIRWTTTGSWNAQVGIASPNTYSWACSSCGNVGASSNPENGEAVITIPASLPSGTYQFIVQLTGGSSIVSNYFTVVR